MDVLLKCRKCGRESTGNGKWHRRGELFCGPRAREIRATHEKYCDGTLIEQRSAAHLAKAVQAAEVDVARRIAARSLLEVQAAKVRAHSEAGACRFSRVPSAPPLHPLCSFELVLSFPVRTVRPGLADRRIRASLHGIP